MKIETLVTKSSDRIVFWTIKTKKRIITFWIGRQIRLLKWLGIDINDKTSI